MSDASHYISTDIGAAELLSLGDACRPIDSLTIYRCILPYYEGKDAETGDTLYEIASTQWDAMRQRIMDGLDPYTQESDATAVDPSIVSVEVRNGTNTTGYGAKMGSMLEELGYDVIGVGNTNDKTTYPETLIIYTDAQYEGAAKAIAASLGSGRAIDGGDYYSSEAGVLAIVGLDWMPVD